MKLKEKRFVFEKAPFRECHASTVVALDERRLLCAFFAGTREGARDVAIWMAYYDGRRWEAVRKVAEEPGVPCWNPVLFRYRNAVYLFYKAGPSPQTWSGFWKRSDDSGRHWSGAHQLPAGLLGPIKNKPLVLADGTVLAGSSVESYNTWAVWVERSEDGMRSWAKSGPVVDPQELFGVIQPTLWVVEGDHLRMAMRATRRIGRVCLADSYDRGRTWTAARRTELPHPSSGLDAVRLRDGRVVLVHNPTNAGRTPLVVAVSEDAGQSWRPAVVLEDEPGEYSYPAVIEAPDGLLHITYTWRRRRIAHAVLIP